MYGAFERTPLLIKKGGRPTSTDENLEEQGEEIGTRAGGARVEKHGCAEEALTEELCVALTAFLRKDTLDLEER
jgi:hypothetical protein